MSGSPYSDDRGNKDATITRTDGVGTMTPAEGLDDTTSPRRASPS